MDLRGDSPNLDDEDGFEYEDEVEDEEGYERDDYIWRWYKKATGHPQISKGAWGAQRKHEHMRIHFYIYI